MIDLFMCQFRDVDDRKWADGLRRTPGVPATYIIRTTEREIADKSVAVCSCRCVKLQLPPDIQFGKTDFVLPVYSLNSVLHVPPDVLDARQQVAFFRYLPTPKEHWKLYFYVLRRFAAAFSYKPLPVVSRE